MLDPGGESQRLRVDDGDAEIGVSRMERRDVVSAGGR